jgi:hypothetical protein
MSALSPLHGSAPDLVEPIVGFRQWRLNGHTLSSLFADVPWRRNELRARCRVGGHDPRKAPSHKRTDLVGVAERLGVPAVAHRELKGVGTQHGSPLHHSLRPARGWATAKSQPPIGAVPRAVSCAILAIHRKPLP